MISLTSLHCPPFDIAFGGNVLLVSRSQVSLPPRKLIFCKAKQQLDSASNVSVHEEKPGSIPVDVIENFPNLPDLEKPVVLTVPATSQRAQNESYDDLRKRAKMRVSVPGPSGRLPPHVLYLLELGFDHEQVERITHKFPRFAYCTLDGKIRPLIEFLLDLGVPRSDLPKVLVRSPRLCGLRLVENVIPSMAFLETLGVDGTKWVKLISKCPSMLTHSRTKIEATVEFLYEVGLSRQVIGKILTRWPEILGCSVEYNLRPSAEYFQSIGVDAALVLRSCPSIIGLSIENNLKPSTEFFLQNGFSIEEVATMVSRFGSLYSCSLKGNVVPKWEFFLTMDYPRQDLIKYPSYFRFSLEERIKPRYYLIKESGVSFSLRQMLSTKLDTFELLLKNKIERLQLED